MARYVVIGLGGSGLSAVNFLVRQGHEVLVTDGGYPPLVDKLPVGVVTAFGGIDGDMLLSADYIVISPGVNPLIEAVVKAKNAGIEVMSDVRLFIQALSYQDKQRNTTTPIVAITGSNAKSTVTTLVGLMAQQAGKIVGVGGNIGTPALELLNITGLQLVVLELSSFQLEHMSNLGASVATILNLSADHLDRHGDMAGYLAQKLKIFDNARQAVICLDDEILAHQCKQEFLSHNANGMILTTSAVSDTAQFYLRYEQDKIYLCHHDQKLLDSKELLIKGKHNLLNALSALALGTAVGLPLSAMLDTLRQFKSLPHRCEFVATVKEKVYFNDSKGTNIGSTIAAIEGLGAVYGERSLALILGGQGKGQDFSELSQVIDTFAKVVYLIGEDAQKIATDLSLSSLKNRLVHAHTLTKAVQLASQSDAKVVLLSPACASLDQFKNYNDRGEQFVALVHQLSKTL